MSLRKPPAVAVATTLVLLGAMLTASCGDVAGGVGASAYGGKAGTGAGKSGGGGSGFGGTTGTAGKGAGAGSNGGNGSGSNAGSGNNPNGGGSSSGGTTSNGGGNNGSGGSDYMPPPVENGCTGYASRFWDCCKPHCGWKDNTSGLTPMSSCSESNASLGSNYDEGSSCSGGGAHTCYSLAPWKVNDNLSYGYAAVPTTDKSNICGRCYQLQFTGSSHNAGDDPGSKSLAGKTMIVQAINIGYDVAGGQFDLLIPGGGVGAFNACREQWDVSNDQLGAQYGGILLQCKSMSGGNHQSWKDCVSNRCSSIFANKPDLAAGCSWFVEWFQVADNPNVVYKEVQCPAELINKSGMDRRSLNDIRTQCN
jgi:hypothetical protein